VFRLNGSNPPGHLLAVIVAGLLITALMYSLWPKDTVLVNDVLLLTEFDHERQHALALNAGDVLVVVIELTGDLLDFEFLDVNSHPLVKGEDILSGTFTWTVNQTGYYVLEVSTKWPRATVKYRVAVKTR